MRPLAPIAVLLLGFATQGCSLLPSSQMRSEGVRSTDLSSIQAGATRAEVEAVLGQPVASRTIDTYKIDTYKYDAGLMGDNKDPLLGDGFSVDPFVLMTVFFARVAVEPFVAVNEVVRRREQEGELVITYGPDDQVVAIERRMSEAEKERQ